VNTNKQDLAAINIPDSNKLIMETGLGGAGKDPSKGEAAAKQHYEDVYDLMRRSFGREFDRIIVCVGAGGGTGGGSARTVVGIAHDICQSFKIEVEGAKPTVGVIVSLPKGTEGGKVNENAYYLLEGLFGMVGKDRGKMGGRTLSPMIIVDNDRINRIYPNLPVSEFWDVANRSVSSLFHLFNSIALQDSEFTTFDKADFEDILDSGVVSFGACPIKKYDSSTDISFAIRDNLKNNVLVGGFDLSHAATAGCVFIGNSDVLNSIPQEHLEHGFEMLSRIMRQGGTVHRGIYKGAKPGLVVYSALGELGKPDSRMEDMAKASGIKK
jgi:cell division GTPase FtsZ